ncbi:MAG: hypothetical protein J6Y89_06640 [Lachnospiraceae bacterium]|nr:hypothetical protein [Lachnospiraceae bacterium]
MLKNIKSTALIGIIIVLIWVVVGLLLPDSMKAGFCFWGGFVFGIIAVAVTFVYLFLFRKKGARTEEVDFIPTVCAFCYMFVSLGLNIAFMVMGESASGELLIGLNILLLLISALVIFAAWRYANGVSAKTELLNAKKNNKQVASAMIAGIMSISDDQDIKKALRGLKEKVDLGNNTSQSFTEELETEFIEKLRGIRGAIDAGSDKTEIINMITSAGKLWSERNAMQMSVK